MHESGALLQEAVVLPKVQGATGHSQERMRHWEMSPQFWSLTALSRKGGTIPKCLLPKYNAQCPPAPPASVRACMCARVCLLLKLLPFGRPQQCLNLLQQLRLQGQTGTFLLKFTLGTLSFLGFLTEHR